MPKGLNLKGFGRRKSAGNALEFEPEKDSSAAEPPASTTFRVLERPDKKSVSYGGNKVAPSTARTFSSPLNALRGKSVDNLGLGPNRGSGGTTNSGSSGYYESSSASARHSSTSTLPSSLDQDHPEEDLFPKPPRKSQPTTSMYQTVTAPTDEPLQPPSSFSTRAARAFSFKSVKSSPKDAPQVPALPPPSQSYVNGAPLNPPRTHSPHRDRAMTTSSYASTAVPPKTELTLSNDFGTDFGDDDFGNMFDSMKKDPLPAPPPPPSSYHRTDSDPIFPPRAHPRNAPPPPTSSSPKPPSRDHDSPYSFDERNSHDGLVSSSTLSSPITFDSGSPGPSVGDGITQAFLGGSKSGYSRVPAGYTPPGSGRNESTESVPDSIGHQTRPNGPAFPSRQPPLHNEDGWTRKVELRDTPPERQLSKSTSAGKLSTLSTSTQRPSQSNSSTSRGNLSTPITSPTDHFESNLTTPRATRGLNTLTENSMFDASPVGPPSRATRPTSSHQRTESGRIKMMTKAQFNALKRQDESSAEQSEEELSGEDFDEEDELEHARRLATQRRKQEANMSVYRQQMKKVTGGGPTDLPSSASTIKPSMERGPNGGIHLGGIGGAPPEPAARGKQDDNDDEDVPLGILQAHGFPSSSRPPTRQGGDDLHQRRTSASGSAVVNGGAGQGNLPPFARRLPADPYFGAGLVNQSTRESLALNTSGGSVVGMSPSTPHMLTPTQQPGAGHPGGLVGVIAGEERARAARRGSPNAAAMMNNGTMPLPSNMSPGMPRTMSMGNVMPPSSIYAPNGIPGMLPMPNMGVPGMMSMPQPSSYDPGQQQMQQFMQMQMQLMQNMISLQQAQIGSPQSPQVQQGQQQTGDYLGLNFNAGRPASVFSQQSTQQPPNTNLQPAAAGRSMTMLNPPTGWGSAANPGGPRPNSAMPMAGGSYAPSVHGLNLGGGGPGPGYTPSIAPSERSNIGMPSRYRPVTQQGDNSRSQSMTSSLTLQAFSKQQSTSNLPGTPFKGNGPQAPKSTIRVVEKSKGAPAPHVDDDDEDGWADMKKKREDKKKSKWSFRRDKPNPATKEPALSELYPTTMG